MAADWGATQRRAAVLAVFSWVLATLAACGSTTAPVTGSPPPPAGGSAPAPPTPSPPRALVRAAPVDEAVAGMRAFGHELYGEVATGDPNTVVSPLSIWYAFAMARAGSGGDTAAEIDEVLGFPRAGLHEALASLSDGVVATDKAPPPPPDARRGASRDPEPPVVAIANGLFVQDGFAVGEPFARTLADHYGAAAEPVDFASGAAAREIDGWVREQTAGRIKKLFDSLDAATRVVLANAVYLKADWALPFAEHLTRPAPFTRADGSVVRVPTMRQEAELRYAAGHGWQAVELPYAGGELAMWVLVAAKGGDPGELLTPGVLAAVEDRLHSTRVDLRLPRWDFATDLDLIPPLQQRGMTKPFTGSADFTGIAPGLFIDQVVHKANITVDEWGTEAAAVTGIAMNESMPPPPDVQMRADRPFAFVVAHTPTGAPVFAGSVGDPSRS